MRILSADTVVKTTKISYDEWLNYRRMGVGGSDAATIVGLNPYGSLFELWSDKLGLLPPKDDSEAMRQGRDFEAYVARRFEEATGLKTRNCNYILSSPKYTHFQANVDRLIVGEAAGLECKTTSVYNKTDFAAGDVPPYYYCQCQHYMMVTGATHWYLAVLVLNSAFYHYKIERNEEDIAALIAAENDFWKLVQTQIPPPPDGSQSCSNAIKKRFEQDDGGTVALFDFNDTAQNLINVKGELKALEKREAELENVIKTAMEGASEALFDGCVAVWKSVASGRVDSKRMQYEAPDVYKKFLKQSTARRFTIKEVKEKTQ